MKKNMKQMALVLGLVLSLTGCKEQEPTVETKETLKLEELQEEAEYFSDAFHFENLDFTNTVFDIPEMDTVKNVQFPVWGKDFSEIEEKLVENLKKFTGLETIERKNIQYNFREKGENASLSVQTWIPCDELTDAEKQNAWYINYNDGRYTAVLYLSNYMLEMGDSGLFAEFAGIEDNIKDRPYGIRPSWCEAVRVKTFYLPEDDISGVSYLLQDGMMSLADAISYVETAIGDYHFLGSDILDYQVYEVSVYRLKDDTYYYDFFVKASYEGLEFGADSGIFGLLDENIVLTYSPAAVKHTVTMFHKERIDYFWSSAHSYESVEVEGEYKELLSLWKATELLSGMLSKDKTFEISAVELQYGTGFVPVEGDSLGRIAATIAYPVYHYTVENPQISGYGTLYFDVNAVTGEIIYWYK